MDKDKMFFYLEFILEYLKENEDFVEALQLAEAYYEEENKDDR